LNAPLKWFRDSPDAGDPDCLCSYCERAIPENQLPIRLFDSNSDLEARFHPACFAEAQQLGLVSLAK
jgi:hypothetical protein